MSMSKKILSFFALLSIFFIIIILGNIELNFDNFFLKTIISNNIWQFIILWIWIFIYWKKLIDDLDK